MAPPWAIPAFMRARKQGREVPFSEMHEEGESRSGSSRWKKRWATARRSTCVMCQAVGSAVFVAVLAVTIAAASADTLDQGLPTPRNVSSSPLSTSHSDWMRDVPTLSFATALVPGTHDTASFLLDVIVRPSVVAQVLGLFGLQGQLHRWKTCHEMTVKAQLESGVRLLDLRIFWVPAHGIFKGDLWAAHGNDLAVPLSIILDDLREFLSEHQAEIVLIILNAATDDSLIHANLCPTDCFETGSDIVPRVIAWALNQTTSLIPQDHLFDSFSTLQSLNHRVGLIVGDNMHQVSLPNSHLFPPMLVMTTDRPWLILGVESGVWRIPRCSRLTLG